MLDYKIQSLICYLFEGLEGALLKKDKGWVSIFSFE